MASDPNKPASDNSSFLGGGTKFNQAGLNAPLPGEKTADIPPPPPLGGPRVWIGVLVVLVMVGLLWLVYGGGLAGVENHGGRGGVSSGTDRPSLNPDQQPSQSQ